MEASGPYLSDPQLGLSASQLGGGLVRPLLGPVQFLGGGHRGPAKRRLFEVARETGELVG